FFGLSQQLQCAGSMAAHVVVVGDLGFLDLVLRVMDVFTRGDDVGMAGFGAGDGGDAFVAAWETYGYPSISHRLSNRSACHCAGYGVRHNRGTAQPACSP